MSFKEARQLEQLPLEIEALEREQLALVARMAEPGWHKSGADQLRADQARLERIVAEITAKFIRWEELDARRASG
jgi:ATP-binding cassette subfamily F protein uup